MRQQIEHIRQELIRLTKKVDNSQWVNFDIVIEFPPYANKGYKALPSFWDTDGKRVRLFLNFDEEFNNSFYGFIYRFNQENLYNQINFSTKKDEYENATISISFNNEIENSFQNNMPKSKRGKTLPWWKNENEIKGLNQ